MDTGLQGKVALVTGAGQGIGRGIALALAGEGCAVAVADVNQATADAVAAEVAACGVRSLAVQCDVAVAADVAAMVTRVTGEMGRLDVLVNNAGVYPFVPVADMAEADWDRVMDINLKGTFLCAKAVAAVLPEGGRIVNISSIASMVGFAGLAHYCASKGGMNGFTRVMALELAPRNITVNAVAPGAIVTPGASGAATEESVKQTIAAIPAGRQGTPEDIAAAVVFLASDAASYVTGQVLVVDGGWTLR